MDRRTEKIAAESQGNLLRNGEEGRQPESAGENKPGKSKIREPISTQWAFQLCDMICQENLTSRFSLAKLICRRCQNDPKKMGFARRPDNRACFLVNAREAHYRRSFNRSAG